MAMPEASEARFLRSDELDTRGITGPKDLTEGFIAIKTDKKFDTRGNVKPFVGIGAVDPRFSNHIIPVITWDASPNQIYIVKPKMGTWTVAAMEKGVPGTTVNTSQLTDTPLVTFNPKSDLPVDVYYTAENALVIS
ncbi:hypothetical protein ACHAPJ_013289 [Fusarium lateritium]